MPAQTKKAKKAEAKEPAKDAPKPPAWPPLEPLPQREDLSLYVVIPDQILTVPSFWTSSLCKKYVTFLSALSLTTTPGTPKRGEAVRVNDRFQVDDPAFAEALWSSTGLKELVLRESAVLQGGDADEKEKQRQVWGGEVLGLSPNIRIYRYRKGQFFDQHYDESNTLMHPGPPSTAARTTWTLLLYLTSTANGCVGGETVFYPEPQHTVGKKGKKNQEPVEPCVVSLQTGMALLHKHGKDCMLHEGREVLEGEKWVIRSDLCVKR